MAPPLTSKETPEFADARRAPGAWWRVPRFAAVVVATALSPSAYDPEMRRAAARQIHLSAWQALPAFLIGCAVLSHVLIRIVVGAAHGFGLSQHALELSIRVLVLEVIPLLAAVSVALRSGTAMSARVALMQVSGELDSLRARGRDPMRQALAPRVLASLVAVLLLSSASSAVAMLLAYEVMYGFSPWAIGQYLRITGQVYSPMVVAGLALKTLFFGLAVAAIPISTALALPRDVERVPRTMRDAMVRFGVILIALEIAFLIVIYT